MNSLRVWGASSGWYFKSVNQSSGKQECVGTSACSLYNLNFKATLFMPA